MSQAAVRLPSFSSSPVRALKSVFESPNWVTNLLWLSIAVLANSIFVGQIGIFGYGTELLQYRAGRPENKSPDIDSNRLGDYITKGLWPFLVAFVVQLVLTVLIMIPVLLAFLLGLLLGSVIDGDIGPAIGMFITVPVIVVLSVAGGLLSVPFLIRAMICQDFQRSFDLTWAKGFAKLMYKEMLVSGIVFMVLSWCILAAGMLVLCVGYIPAGGIVCAGFMHLMAQWYEIYLSLGGEPAPPPISHADVIDATLV